MALLGSVSCPVILMSWAILSLPTLEQWVLFSFCPFSFCQISLFVSITNPSFFELQPIIQEHEELVWLAESLKLKTNYLKKLYGPRGVAHLGGGYDDNDNDGGEEEDSKTTPSYQPRKRRHHWLPAVTTHIGIQHTTFFLFFWLLVFFFPF